MFFDKLWLRIRGELLALSEDDSVTEELRAKAARLLDCVQERVSKPQEPCSTMGPGDQEPTQAREHDVSEPKNRELAGIERQWREIATERDRQKQTDPGSKPPPNPRQLG